MTHVQRMIRQVLEGKDPREVLETSLALHPGSSARVNKDTTASEIYSGDSISVPRGTVPTIYGVGGGPSGADHAARLPDGRNVSIPNADLGESCHEGLVGAVAKITLAKPLPQGTLDWLETGYVDSAVMLSAVPIDDTPTSLVFMMKAADDDALEAGIAVLKGLAGASFKSSVPASLNDWQGA